MKKKSVSDSIFDNFFVYVAILTVVVLVSALGLATCINYVVFPGQLAAIEQLRENYNELPPMLDLVVLGEVAKTNEAIASAQAYRDIPVIRWTLPADWDDVDLIDLRKAQ